MSNSTVPTTDWIHFMDGSNDFGSSLNVDSELKLIGGSFCSKVCVYDGTALEHESPEHWVGALESRRQRDHSLEVTAHFKAPPGGAKSSGVALGFRFADWSTKNYVMVPGAVYAGNRFRCLPVEYPPVFSVEDHRPDVPVTITDVPRLNIENGASQVELLSSSTTCPAVGIYMPERKKAVLLMFPDRTRLGQNGIVIEESPDRRSAVVVLTAPGIRQLQYGGMHLHASSDRATNWKRSETLDIKMRVVVFDASSQADLLDRFLRIRKVSLEPNHQRQLTPYSFALKSEIGVQNNERWFEPGGYYKNGNGDSPFGHIQLGWVGGLMSTYPILVDHTEPGASRALKSIDTTLRQLAAPSGLFFGMYKNGVLYGDNFDEMTKKPEIAMIRKNGDGLYYLLKHFGVLKESEIRPEWKVAARRWADAFATVWHRYGQFGQLVNVKTGEIAVGGSTAGAIIPAALSLASRYFGDPQYLLVAEQSARMMVNRDLRNGYTTGGPGEILQCPDSESAFGLLESLVVLYETTGDKEWLRDARTAAALASTWVVAYDFPFPSESELGKVDARSSGAVWASIQNKHAAPGICSASGDCLLKLYRATGDRVYMDLLQDIAHNILEFMSRRDRAIGAAKDGYVNERVNTSDWEGSGGVGAVGDSSVSWCEVAVMLTCTDLPSIYVDKSRKRVWSFDHIDAKLLSDGRLSISNSTSLSAEVRLMAEEAGEMRRRDSNAPNHPTHRIHLEPGATKTISI